MGLSRSLKTNRDTLVTGFALRQRNKRPRRNDITVLKPLPSDLKLIKLIEETLPIVKDMLKYCRDGHALRGRSRTHYVEKAEKVYVYRYLEVENDYGNVVFRAREGTPEAKEAEELVMLRNALRRICDALATIAQDGEFVLRQRNKRGGD